MAKKQTNNPNFYRPDLFGATEASKGAHAAGGRHTRANLAKLAGPPEASHSIATGTLKTKSRLAAEAQAAQAAQGYAYGEGGGYDGNAGWDAGYDQGYYGEGYAQGYDSYGYDGATAYDASGYGTYDQSYSADAAYDYGYGYNQNYTYDANYAGTYDANYDPAYNQGYPNRYDRYDRYDQGAYGEYREYNEYGAATDGWDAPWMTPGADAEPPKKGLAALFARRNKRSQAGAEPAPTMSATQKYDAEAAARARANAVVDAYESGVPLGLALGGYDAGYDGYGAYDAAGYDDAAAQGAGAGAGTPGTPGVAGRLVGAVAGLAAGAAGARAGAGKRSGGAGVPSLAGMGVQVQIPTASMEKSLTMSANATHQKRVDAGTGSKFAASKGSHAGFSRQKTNTYGADRELGKLLRRRIIMVLIILAVVAVAAVVGAGVGYVVSLSNRLGLDDLESVQEILKEPEPNTPYYVLFVADLDDRDGSNEELDAMLLARIDEQNQKVSLLAIPGNIEVILSDFDYHPATDARADGGNAQLISSLSALLEVDIAHFVMADAPGLAAIVDALGGVEMTLEQEIDDPQAGWEYFLPGTYKLDGQQALQILRADNFHEGETTRGEHRCQFGKNLMEKILSSGFLSFANITDTIAGNISTDFTASEIISLARTMAGVTAADVLSGVAPGSQETTIEGVRVFSPLYTSLKQVMELMDAGVNPVLEDRKGVNVNPADVSVTVWNGSGVVGGAAMLGDILTGAGFDVQIITNAAAYAYTETLIVYDDKDNADAAYAAQKALGQGRVLDGTWKYTFTTDILVILGSEWK